jgi:2-C-methyl-D-erythritol 4-phosphate cytidylyltransferase
VRKILHEASQQDAVIPCIPSPVPNIVFSGSPNALVSIPSHQLRIIQSPQAYRRERLLQIYELAAQHGWQFQTTVELMHAAQQATTIVPGEENNIKITMPLDWQIAEKILFALLKPQPV